MMKKLIRFVLVLALGAIIGYLLSPTIDGLLGKQELVNTETVETLKDKANDKADSLINK